MVGKLEPERASRYKVGDTFGQEVVVTRRSAFRTLGIEIGQAAQYVIVSRLTVTKIGPDGGATVTQTIEGGRLVDADPTMRESLTAALAQIKGAALEIVVGPTGDVVRIRVPKDPVRLLVREDPVAGKVLRVWSLLDEDGWKELAGITFFQPVQPLQRGRTWARNLTHDWGALGEWRGRTVYTDTGRQGADERITYAHALSHRPPQKVAENMPVRVLAAEFAPVTANGVILYDPVRGRVSAAEEVFRVKGAVSVSTGVGPAAIEVEEEQGFRLRVTDPANRALVGGGAPPGLRAEK
ncbi:hypothetical protein [Fimbriiglobus ruber]|uniref:hypothetical protein n=1 Tax=Fimbriiglobus ruber TaxID=1908690 RepID=UPI00117B6A58|nr:hypothetical protein [Fimbriiglobus ruber]